MISRKVETIDNAISLVEFNTEKYQYIQCKKLYNAVSFTIIQFP